MLTSLVVYSQSIFGTSTQSLFAKFFLQHT